MIDNMLIISVPKLCEILKLLTTRNLPFKLCCLVWTFLLPLRSDHCRILSSETCVVTYLSKNSGFSFKKCVTNSGDTSEI